MKRTTAPVTARQRLVVIGNGMAGFKFCEKFVRYRLQKKFDLVVLGEEEQPAYDRVNLTRYLTHGEDRILAPASWYTQQGIQLRTGDKVWRIQREKKCVETASGAIVPYDRLILATGSKVYMPPVEGISLPGVLPYRTLHDLRVIRAHMKECKRAIVIGGGLLGLEAAKAMLDGGMETVIIERAGQLMPRQLDPGAGSMLLEQVKASGLHVFLNKEISGISQVDGELRMSCWDGDVIGADMIVCSAGIVPRDELGRATGLAIGTRGGIVVNNHMVTSDPSIYAIGECALAHGKIWGLAVPCYEMAEVLAARLAGIYKVFRGDLLFTQLKVLGTKLAHIAAVDDEQEEGEHIVLEKKEEGIYKRIDLSADGKRIRNVILLGDVSDYASLLQMVRMRTHPPSDPAILLNGTGSSDHRVASLSDATVICLCQSVNKGALAQAITRDGLQRIDQVCRATGAGTGCETCHALIEEMINYYAP